MSQGFCSSCGAKFTNETKKCIYCGTLHFNQNLTQLNLESLSGRRRRRSSRNNNNTQPDEAIVLSLLIEDIRNEIFFLEEQYRETHHPSIMQKIENKQNELNQLLEP